jgi:hypothetical protein
MDGKPKFPHLFNYSQSGGSTGIKRQRGENGGKEHLSPL